MYPVLVFKLIDKLLWDISMNENRNKIFGSKPILMRCDFRQTLPEILYLQSPGWYLNKDK